MSSQYSEVRVLLGDCLSVLLEKLLAWAVLQSYIIIQCRFSCIILASWSQEDENNKENIKI